MRALLYVLADWWANVTDPGWWHWQFVKPFKDGWNGG